jgi:hypothetical protein
MDPIEPSHGHLRLRIAALSDLRDMLVRQFLISLHERGIVTIDQVYQEAAARGARPAGNQAAPPTSSQADPDPNAATARQWSEADKAAIEEVVIGHAERALTPVEIDDLVNLVQKREKARSLEDIANLPNVPSLLLVSALKEFCSLPVGGITLKPSEAIGTRVALIRHFVSDRLDFIPIAKHRFTIRYLEGLVKRILFTERGSGRIGGKAAGLALARAILETPEPDDPVDFARAVRYPESWYVATDVCEAFINRNALHEFRTHKYKTVDEIRDQYRMIREIFRNSPMPAEVLPGLKRILQEAGDAPLIVRSSSLLEDNFGSAFSGKYDSIFLGNQGTPDDRLQALAGAIKEVYSSMFGPDPILYRRNRNLIDYDESMAILIQRVVGRPYRNYYLPLYAGVAFSLNEYRWCKRIRREDGMVRIVLGLGTRAVDRVARDYPRLIPLGNPTIRPEVDVKDIRYYSQHYVDAIDRAENRLVSRRLEDVLQGEPFPGLYQVVSQVHDQMLVPPLTNQVDLEQPVVVTFERFVRDRQGIDMVRAVLKKLERVYGSPVDLEFAHDGEALHLLQCRPQARRLEMERVRVPRDMPDEDRVFTADRYVNNGLVAGVEYVLYVDPDDYDALGHDAKLRVARLVGQLNTALAGRRFILMGPGRWGSNNLDLGIRVRYADISNTRMLIEVARRKGGMLPDVSFGTHFFQDLVEARIQYLPLYPGEPGSLLRDDFLRGAANSLPEVLPAFADLAERVHLVHLPSVTGGRTLTVAMDGEEERALAFLSR